MGLLIAQLIVVAALAAYIASLLCRLAQRGHRRPGWRQAALAVAFVEVLWGFWLLAQFLVNRREWDSSDRSYILISFVVPFTFAIVSVFALIGAGVTVAVFRRKFRDDDDVA
jgi:hypothetical protein